ncbi:MAG: tRNA (adenosine(37)-N6)-dimethylallyltransferase MiaA [Bacteroidetes bacterium]|nr:tRNA (adenosine(37)-N6)-dimethylallyltransferase MiaA [Bacteroidota bacterium]
MKSTLIVIGGPTASGKSALAMNFARHLKTEIISADSRQCFKEMTIGTAKPPQEDLEEIKHHFVNSHSIHQHFSAGIFAEESQKILSKLFKEKEYVVVVGGTGLYIRALTDGLDVLPTVEISTRENVKSIYREKGIEALLDIIREKDPDYLPMVDQQNPSRLMRAAEILLQTNEKYSVLLGKAKEKLPYQVLKLVIHPERSILYKNIDQRVDQMMEMGMLEEVKSLIPHKALTTLHTVGYSEMFDYLDGKTTLEYAIDKIKQHSRNYAKRQITWFKNQDEFIFLDPAVDSLSPEDILQSHKLSNP